MEPQNHWNFAYGANINRWKLEKRRGIKPVESVPGKLKEWQLSFNHRGGMGTLDQGTGSTVHGVCHLLAPSDYATLCRMEEGYSEVEVVVEAYDGRAITATIFCSLPDRRTTDGIPPLRYLKLLQEGAREWDLDQGYRVWLDSLPSIPDNVCRNYARGSCKFGGRCRYLHASPAAGASSNSQPLGTASRNERRQGGRHGEGASQGGLGPPPGLHPAGPQEANALTCATLSITGSKRHSRVQHGALAGVASSSKAGGSVTHAEGIVETGSVEWRLVYWPGFPGRGEFIRLMFEETATPFQDDRSAASVKSMTMSGRTAPSGYPCLASPVLQNLRTGFSMGQTMAIMRYLAKNLDGGRLLPKTDVDQAHADMIVCGVADLVEEGHAAWHPVDSMRSAAFNRGPQQDAQIKLYASRRVPKWLAFLESALQANPAGEGYFFGNQLSYVDLCVFHLLNGLAHQLPQDFQAARVPKLKALRERVASRPRISSYMDSPRCQAFTGTGPIF
ncbi:hypothetical protein CYMTET_37486 [Cymbomonas tetramitiformis]|uniref:Gamma-glutamylcyclotransferase n=1 Tax=Cymbomonas tetramitiformis TaxID=36881 RepID=A0AAE0CG10_9CHLO|nr:hypothetical protein CYMTET_37486 [Cymbomonas tetramitiformis]